MKPRTRKSEGIAARLLIAVRQPQPKVNGITRVRGNAAERAAARRLAEANTHWLDRLMRAGLSGPQISIVISADQALRNEWTRYTRACERAFMVRMGLAKRAR